LKPFKSNGEQFDGRIKDVTNNGQLIVSFGADLRLFDFKEIEFLNKP
jgi:BirA family biotin operon repressor/biotin-[acetyl-CoA-carboxylase] ligase